ncbi:MAG: hypothetical protein DMD81_05805 [Candidatus Rokuibacteriota bacterium]|nr:MAG: hypothetical protein DMD81_05805 [Candidatus Rokubacteria bacterium]
MIRAGSVELTADRAVVASDLAREAVAGAGISVDVVTAPSAFLAMRQEWDDLLHASRSDSIFLTWEWLATWWKHLGAPRRLSLITLRRQGGLIGVAPLAVSPPALSRLIAFHRLEFLGTGSVGSDYLDVIVRDGCESQALPALVETLDRMRLPLDLGQVNGVASSAGALTRELAGRGWTVTIDPSGVCPHIGLGGLTWPSYLATLTAHHRSNFKRRWNALLRDGAMRFELVTSEAERRVALAALVDLHRRRRSERGGSNALHTPALLAFHEDFTSQALERGWLRLFVMKLGDKPVGSIYGLRYGKSLLFYQTGFDPEHARQGVGQVMVGLTIRHAFDEGLEDYDLLHGDEPYKFDWARNVRELKRATLFPPGVRGGLERVIADLGHRVRREARRWVAWRPGRRDGGDR